MPAITAIELSALRKADSVCFDLIRRDGEVVSQIRAIKRVEPTAKDPYARDITLDIPVDWTGPRDAIAFEAVMSAKYNDAWQTIVKLLRVGDEITLVWVSANNNQYVTEAGLFNDELRMRVQRGKTRLTFNVDHSICADNTARMIRTSAYSLR